MPCYETTFGWNRTHDHLMRCLGHQRFHQTHICVFFSGSRFARQPVQRGGDR